MKFGIENFEISQKCEHIELGNICLTMEQMNHCNNVLGNLDPSSTNNSSIENTCDTIKEEDGETHFLFTLNYLPNFIHDEECLT